MEFCVSNRSRLLLITLAFRCKVFGGEGWVPHRSPFVSVTAKARNMRNAHLNEAGQEGAANMKRHISIAVPLWPSSCTRNIRERACRANSGTVDAPDQPLRKPSLPVANLAINLGPLVSPVQEGEMNELFIKRESSQA